MSSNDNQPNSTDNMARNRRSSVTSAALSGIFRSASTSTASTGTPIFPNSLDPNRRRLSISTTAALGLGSVPGSASSAGPSGVGASAFALRRASLSTNSSASDAAVDESAIEDDDAPPSGARNAPNSPYGRRLSFGAQAVRSNDQGYNWPEQLRSRAESTISGARSSFSHASGMGNSPPRASGFAGYGGGGGGGGGVGSGGGVGAARHDRAKSVLDVPRQAPVQSQPAPRPEARKKPDPFQERILKGDFYMD
ncbi:hypothetical protein F503_08340 [Ophiostoma piceae UAMH 11346]|uniref:Uncharacterized protein n=1 Tax=Ophiostoma piceae (strain UAMH 11346) TaxID=1262450 RepID=S3BX37_OPHP1|nr:hypothetical protein F503_08340 [Ophiostoma piceae UAMH 11346]